MTINAGNTLTLGAAATDIDMSSATQDLTLNCPLALGAANVWDVNTGRALTLGGEVSGAFAVTKQGLGTAILSGVNIYTGNTVVSNGTLDITGTLNGTSLALGGSAAKTVVNVSNDMTLTTVNGASVANSFAIYNQTAGTVTSVGNAATTHVANAGGYGYLNLTGGSYSQTANRFSVTNSNGTAGGAGVVYVGGAGTLNLTGTTSMIIGYAGMPASLTVGPGGSVDRSTGTGTFWLTTNAGSYGVLNVAGGDFNTAGSGIRIGNSNAGGQLGFVNLAKGTLTLGINGVNGVNAANGGTLYSNYAGGTMKAANNLTAVVPVTNANLTSISTIYGPITNNNNADTAFNTQIGTTSNFDGGLTVDTNNFAVTYTSPLLGATGNGVKQSDITVTGGSGYIGAPMVQFTGGTGTPATGYAVLSGGAVTGIVITSPGDYSVDPTGVTLTGGGGTGASVALGALTANPADSGLTKINSGTLTLTNTNTYAGPTLVSGGTLALGGSGSVNSSSGITVNGSGVKLLQTSSTAVSPTVTLTQGTVTGSSTVNTLNVDHNTGGIVSNNNGVAGAALTIDTLTFNGTATVNTFSSTTSAPLVTTSLSSNAAGIVTLNPSNASWVVGTPYDLISYGGGSIAGAGSGQFALGTVSGASPRQSKVLADSGTAITLTIGADDSPYWSGDGDDKWNLASTNNWKLLSDNSPTLFLAGDNVLFNDNATGAGPINVDIDLASVATLSTTFDNSSKNYVLGSTGGFGISAGSLTKTGTGDLSIGSINTYSGATAINLGSITMSGTGTLGSGSAVALGGGALNLGTTSQTVGAVSVTTPAASGDTIGNGDLTGTSYAVSNASGTAVISANLLGTGAFTKTGDGSVTLSGNNSYGGLTSAKEGILTLTGNRTVAPTANPGFDVGGTGSPLGTLNLQGDLEMGATQFRVGANGPGTTFQTTGVLNFTGGSQLTLGVTAGMPGIYNLSGGSINTVFVAHRGLIIGTNASCSGTFNLSGTGILNMAPTSVLMIGRSENVAATGTSATFNQTGGTATAGELRMGGNTAGNNANQTALLDLSGGVFTAAGFTALSGGDGSVSTINIRGTADVTLPAFPTTRGTGASATINFDGGTLKPAAASATYMGGLTDAFIKVGGANLDTTNGSITITQNLLTDVVSTGGGLTKAGTNDLTLSGTNTYTGATNISNGRLYISTTGSLGTTDAGTVVSSGATLGTLTTLAVPTGETLNLSGTGSTGVNGALYVGGSKTLTWDGPITLSGNTLIHADGGSAFSLTSNATVNLGANTLTFDAGNGANSTIAGVISGSGGISKTLGTTVILTLSGSNTYTGSTTISAGTLSLTNTNPLGTIPGTNGTSGITIDSGATLRSATSGANPVTTIAAPITLTAGGNTNLLIGQGAASNTHTFNLNGAIGGATTNLVFSTSTGSFSNGSSVFVLGAAGTYTGDTLITSGNGANNPVFVKAGTGIVNALPVTTVLTFDGLNGGGTGRNFQYDMNGNDQTLAGLTNTVASLRRQIFTNSGALATLTINNASNMSFGGSDLTTGSTTRAQITGAIALIKSGAGTFTLGGTLLGGATAGGNTFTGDTKILGGILSLGETLSLQNSALDTANSITGDATNGLQTTVTTLRLGGLTGNKNLASLFETTAGGYSGLTALTLNPGTGATPSYSGAIADGASGMTLTKTGAGTQTLTGPNSYTGATSVTAGILAIGANNVIPDVSPVSIGTATLDAGASVSDTLGNLDAAGTAKINIGSGATLAFADSSGVDWTGGTLDITGTFSSGSSLRFGTNSSGLTATQLGLITLNGAVVTFTLDSSGYLVGSAGGYGTWASTNAPTGTPSDDYDGDGVSNALEYLLGGTAITNDLGKLPTVSTSGGNLLFTFKRDQASIDGTTTATVEVGTTLATWPDSYSVPDIAAANNPGITVVKDVPTGFDTVTLTVPQAPDAKKFAHLKVTVVP